MCYYYPRLEISTSMLQLHGKLPDEMNRLPPNTKISKPIWMVSQNNEPKCASLRLFTFLRLLSFIFQERILWTQTWSRRLHTAVKPLACWQKSTEPIESEPDTHFDCWVCVFWVSSFCASFAVTLNTTMMSVGSAQQLFGWQNPEKYHHFSCALENSMHSFRSSGQNKNDVAVHSFLQKSFIFTFDFWMHFDNSVALNYVK